MIAGPILRASRFLPQLAVRRNPDAIRVNRAFLLIVGGSFKKVVISNMLATRLVEPVFSVPRSFGAGDTLLAIYGYAAQIYCDFSAYTGIAMVDFTEEGDSTMTWALIMWLDPSVESADSVRRGPPFKPAVPMIETQHLPHRPTIADADPESTRQF